jgi:hypothetical protein
MLTQEQATKLCSNNGFEYFKNELQHQVDDNEYWTILRALWIEDGKCSIEWEILLFYSGRKREHKIMKSSDRQYLKKLPKQIKVYRACFEETDKDRWNWTLNKDFAEKWKNSIGAKFVAEKTIDKKQIFAYFNSRREDEIILKKNIKKY